MTIGFRDAALLAGLLAAAACATRKDVDPLAARFAQAALTSVSAEQAFLDDVDRTSILAKTAVLRARWNREHKAFEPEDMTQPAPVVSPPARAAITKVLAAVKAYAEALQALATDGATGTLDQNAKKLAEGMENFDKDALSRATADGKPMLSSGTLDAAVAGVRAIAAFVIQAEIAEDVQQAARARNDDLASIVDALKQINEGYAAIAGSEVQVLKLSNASVVRGGAASISDFDRLTSEGFALAAGADPQKVNAALDAMAAGNLAIASARPGGAIAQVQEFARTAADAYDYYTSLRK